MLVIVVLVCLTMVALRADLEHSLRRLDFHQIGNRNGIRSSDVYAVVQEGCLVPQGGVEFDLPSENRRHITKSLLSSCRRLHINIVHPPNADLARVVRLSGGSELAQKAILGLNCTICRKALPAKSPKPGKPRNNVGQFNDSLLADVGFECDVDGTKHAFLILLDEGANWMVCKYLGVGQHTRTAQQLYHAAEDGWISWAGPPDVFVAGNERSFCAEIFPTKLGQAGTLYDPTAGYAP